MAIFEWKNEYSLGYDTIDQQHKQLFILANNVYEIAISDKNIKNLERILLDLKEYTVYHFKEEENIYLKKINIVYTEHKAEHEKFKLKVDEFLLKFKTEGDVDVLEFLAFLIDWLIEHIQGLDKKHLSYIIVK